MAATWWKHCPKLQCSVAATVVDGVEWEWYAECQRKQEDEVFEVEYWILNMVQYLCSLSVSLVLWKAFCKIVRYACYFSIKFSGCNAHIVNVCQYIISNNLFPYVLQKCITLFARIMLTMPVPWFWVNRCCLPPPGGLLSVL